MPNTLKRSATVRARTKPPIQPRLEKMETETLTEDMEIDESMASMKVSEPAVPKPSSSGDSASAKPKKGTLKRSASLKLPSADSNNNRSSSADLSIAKRRKQSISISHEHEKGVLYAFGQNDVGQIGIENAQQRKFPAKVELLTQKAIQVAAGSMHTVVLDENNKVFTFGCNDDCALGRVTQEEEDQVIPEEVPFQEKIIQVTAGDSHSTALTDTGRVYFWGSFRNSAGNIGLQANDGGRRINVPTLVRYSAVEEFEPKIVKVASGTNHVIALSSDSEVYSLGDGENGQLGRYVTARTLRSRTAIPRTDAFLQPEKIFSPGMKNVCDVWAGGCSTFCKTAEGEIWSFGLNATSQLGWSSRRRPTGESGSQESDNMSRCQFIPRKPTSFNTSEHKPWKQIAIGDHHTIALNEAGKVFGLGGATDGRLGLGDDQEEKSAPTLIPTLAGETCVQVACGGSTSYAVTSSGKLYAWGFGENFQLGNGEEEDEDTPALVKGSRNEDGINGKVVYTSAGSQHVAIITAPKDQ